MSLIGTLIIGLLVGIVAKFLMPGKDPGGFIITIALGVAGAVASAVPLLRVVDLAHLGLPS